MARPTVLMVTYHFPPQAASGAFRLLGFARHLPKHGWSVAVVAPPAIPWEPVDPALGARVPAETALYPVPYTTSRLVRRVAQVSGWLPSAAKACGRAIREQRPAVILTSGPPQQVHWLGLWLKRRYGLPWVADFRDPWFPEGRTERGRDLASWQVSAQEAVVMGAADLVVVNTPGALRTLGNAYPRHRAKFLALTNGYDPETFDVAPDLPLTPARPPRVVHTGAMYWGRDPRGFLDALRSFPDTTADFFGPPPETGLDLAAEAHRRGLSDRVRILGHVPYARCVSAMVGADVLLLIDCPGKTQGVPAKLYEYLGAGRPVLALAERGGDVEWVLAQSGARYRIAPMHDPGAIAQALTDLLHEAAAHAPRLGAQAFSREVIAGRLAERLDSLAGQGAGAGLGREAVGMAMAAGGEAI